MTLPNFAIIGAARSGTTAIAEALRRHPDAFVTTPKEPHYFAFAGQALDFRGPGDAEGINATAVTDPAAYRLLYEGSELRLARGEGSVSTLYFFRSAIPTISATNPDMRLVAVLREPVDRAFSAFQYLRVRGREPEADFATAVSLEAGRRAAGWHHLWHYTAMSRYADAVEAFLAAFGPDRLRVLFYDEVTADPATALRQVYVHLGLDPGRAPVTEAPHVNRSGRPRSVRTQAAINSLGSSPRMRRAGRLLVPFGVRERVRGWNQTTESVSLDVRAELAPLFKDDLARLAGLVGRSLPPAWRAGPA